MISRSRIAVVLALVGCCAHLTAREARAADPRLVRVVLLRVADRMALALEMTGEPQKAALRVLSDRALEIEAGPVSGLVKEEQLAPASEGALIRQVSIQKYTNANRVAFVRARVMFDAPGAGNVRVVGRTVYVDLAPMVAFRPVLPRAPRLERREEPTPRSTGCACASRNQLRRTATRLCVRPQPKSAPPNSYEQEVRPVLARLTEIGPFLASAAKTPADDVLRAVGGTLAEVEQPLRVMNVPQASRPVHNVLLSAVAMASRAVAPDFRGDRVDRGTACAGAPRRRKKRDSSLGARARQALFDCAAGSRRKGTTRASSSAPEAAASMSRNRTSAGA